MANLGTIVTVKPGLSIPKPYLEKLSAAHNTAMGFAAADDDGSVGFINLRSDKHDFIENVGKLCTTYNTSTCCFHFANLDNRKLSEIEEQPYPILANGDKVILAAMLEGDFPNYAKGDHVAELNVMREFLAEACKELYQANKEDLEEMMKAAGQPTFRRLIKGALTPRGAILLVPGVGDPLLFAERIVGDDKLTGAIYSWGLTTRSLGYVEGKASEPAKTEALKTMSKQERLAAMYNTTATLPKEETKSTSVPPVPDPKTDTKIPDKVVGAPVVYCPDSFVKKDREQWVRRNVEKAHQFIKGWDGKLAYTSNMIKKDSPLQAQFKTVTTAAENHEAGKQERQTPDEHLPKSTPGIEKGPLPVISPTSKKHVMGLIGDGVLIVDPKQFQALEKEFDPLTAQLAINPDTPLFWTYEGYTMLCQHNLVAAATLLEEFRRRILKGHPEIINQMMEKLTRPPAQADATKTKLTPQEKLEKLYGKAAA